VTQVYAIDPASDSLLLHADRSPSADRREQQTRSESADWVARLILGFGVA
jgi:hypothetical protein